MNAHTQNSEYGRLSEATQCFGLSRSCLYLLAGRKAVRFVKIGGSTLVDFGSIRSYLETLPTAQLGENRDPLAVKNTPTNCGEKPSTHLDRQMIRDPVDRRTLP